MTKSPSLPALESLVPHRRPMLLLDRLIEIDSRHAVTEVDVHPQAVFATGDGVPGWVGIEYMAQTVATIGGWRALQRGDPVSIGFLLGTRRYAPGCRYFELGSTLRVSAQEEWSELDGMARFACAIGLRGEQLTAVSLTVYQPSGRDLVEASG